MVRVHYQFDESCELINRIYLRGKRVRVRVSMSQLDDELGRVEAALAGRLQTL